MRQRAHAQQIGPRLGPLDLSAVATAGTLIAWRGASVDERSWGDVTTLGYLGYGAHVALHPGKLLLDGLVLREHQFNATAPIATRADAIVGYLFDPQFYAALRLRYVAQTDLKDASATSDRFLSVVAALVSQF